MEKLSLWRLLISIIIIAVLSAYSYNLRYSSAIETSLPELDSIPASIDGFKSTEKVLTSEEIEMLGADKTLYRIYSKDGEVIRLFIGYFSTQQENSQIHSPKHCYPGAGWNIAGEGKATAMIGNRPQNLKYILISDGQNRRVVLYWFRTYDSYAANEFELKWIQVKNSILKKPQMAAFVRLSTDLGKGEELEEKLGDLSEFAEEISPYLENILGAAKRNKELSLKTSM